MSGQHGLGRIDYEGRDARDVRVETTSLRRVASYFLPYWGLILAVFASVVLTAVLGVVPPLLIKAIIDEALPAGDLGKLNLLVAAMIAAGVLAGLVQVLQNG